ncbi:unnamed protein product [Arabis nemorensis]|uniref:Uncharacterized protein n=1 Tax=Arabis nemorensis TaxID=586526 RepID=A0A565CSC4_9BRAS|nr:unnamed protein product [Arabis nemorensis]
MSLFFSRISARRNNARFFSSLPQSPCLLLGSKTLREFPEGKIVNQLFFNPAKEETVCSREKKVPKELDGQIFVGASQGWVASVNNKDLTVHLTDLHKPWVSSPRLVSLPSLEFKPSTYATEMSLSTCDPVQDQDFTVAAKFNESRLSI